MSSTTHPVQKHRRPLRLLVAACIAVAAVVAAPNIASAVPSYSVGSLDLANAGVPEVREGLESGDFTSVELVKAYLDRSRRSASTAHTSMPCARSTPASTRPRLSMQSARTAAVRGPLHGVPVLLKDNIDAIGMPTTAGSIALAESFPAGDAALAAELKEAGAIVLGKTNLSEFANFITNGMPSGYSSLGGQVLNPYDASQTPSGWSAGSAWPRPQASRRSRSARRRRVRSSARRRPTRSSASSRRSAS